MTKQEVIEERERLNDKFWVALNSQNWTEVELIEKQVARCESLLRIYEDEEDIKSNPSIPLNDMLNFMKRIKQN